jgi:hypothetical protein
VGSRGRDGAIASRPSFSFAFTRSAARVDSQHMDELSKLRAILDACHRVLAQLKKIHAGEDNPFAERIRETCRDAMARLATLQGTSLRRTRSALRSTSRN